jgi:hypothetical protein
VEVVGFGRGITVDILIEVIVVLFYKQLDMKINQILQGKKRNAKKEGYIGIGMVNLAEIKVLPEVGLETIGSIMAKKVALDNNF